MNTAEDVVQIFVRVLVEQVERRPKRSRDERWILRSAKEGGSERKDLVPVRLNVHDREARPQVLRPKSTRVKIPQVRSRGR